MATFERENADDYIIQQNLATLARQQGRTPEQIQNMMNDKQASQPTAYNPFTGAEYDSKKYKYNFGDIGRSLDSGAFSGPDNSGFNARAAAIYGQSQPDVNRNIGNEQQLISQLFAQSQGQGPSLAGQQFQNSLEQGIAAQRAQAASGGFNPAAQRLAAQNIASATQQGAGQSALLRLQEQQQAQQALGSVIGQARSSDLQQQQQYNQLVTQYEQLGLSRDLAAAQAKQDLETTRLNTFLKELGIKEGVPQTDSTGQLIGAGLSGLAAVGMLAASDNRVKENVKPLNDTQASFSRALAGVALANERLNKLGV